MLLLEQYFIVTSNILCAIIKLLLYNFSDSLKQYFEFIHTWYLKIWSHYFILRPFIWKGQNRGCKILGSHSGDWKMVSGGMWCFVINDSSSLMTEAAGSSEASVYFYRTTLCHNSQRSHCHKKLQSHNTVVDVQTVTRYHNTDDLLAA
jgi:hypothetical protein